jgi:hypothetical protein
VAVFKIKHESSLICATLTECPSAVTQRMLAMHQSAIYRCVRRPVPPCSWDCSLLLWLDGRFLGWLGPAECRRVQLPTIRPDARITYQ